MIRTLKMLAIYFKVGLIRHFIYRGSMVTDFLSRFISIIFLFFLWITIFQNRTTVGDQTLSSILVYYTFAYMVRMLANPNVASMTGEQIKSGKLQSYLVRPTHPILSYIGMTTAKRFSELFIFLLFSVVLLAVIFPYYHIVIGSLYFGRFLIFLLIAMTLAFMIGFLVGCSAFWITDYTALTYGLNPLTGILAGLLVPLSLFPHNIQKVLELLPFKYMVSVPVLVLQGKIMGSDLLYTFLIGLVWIAVFTILIKIIWNKGLRAFDAVGN